MAHHHDMLDLQRLHGIFERRRGAVQLVVGREGRHQIGDIAHHEHLAGPRIEDRLGRDARIAAADQHDLRGLAGFGELLDSASCSRVEAVVEEGAIALGQPGRKKRRWCIHAPVEQERRGFVKSPHGADAAISESSNASSLCCRTRRLRPQRQRLDPRARALTQGDARLRQLAARRAEQRDQRGIGLALARRGADPRPSARHGRRTASRARPARRARRAASACTESRSPSAEALQGRLSAGSAAQKAIG